MIIIPGNIQTICAIYQKGKKYIIIGWIHGNYEIICMSHCWPFLRYNHGAAIFSITICHAIVYYDLNHFSCHVQIFLKVAEVIIFFQV